LRISYVTKLPMSEPGTPPVNVVKSRSGESGATAPPVEEQANLPAVIEQGLPRHARRRRPGPAILVILLIVGVGAGIGWVWWQQHQSRLPPGIAWGNGRLEADEIDIDTKFAGRIAKLFVDEGDMVTPGQVVAMMDTRDLEASLKKSEALVNLAHRALDEAKANLVQQQTQVTLAQQELERTRSLVPKGFATVELLDQRRQQLNSTVAVETAATHKIAEAQHALDAATHDAELYRVNILDNTLVAPRDGRIEYRVANIGEVLPAGGKVFTMLDASYVYMDIYLPTAEAGRIRIGSEARIVLDAYPDHVIPAKVVFVASQAQFTPKTVETKAERDKLMFRIRVRIDPERLKGREGMVRSGLPGLAYVRTDPSTSWPPNLQASPPP
jgi:HlyD family secretion protein